MNNKVNILNRPCDICEGTGTLQYCSFCGGTGRVGRWPSKICIACAGTAREKCSACCGSGVVSVPVGLDAPILTSLTTQTRIEATTPSVVAEDEELVRAPYFHLQIIAYVFIVSGVIAGIDGFACLFENSFYLNFGIIGLFIGPGLLRLGRAWRKIALIVAWILAISYSLAAIISLVSGRFLELNYGCATFARLSPLVSLLLYVPTVLYNIWVIVTLNRNDVKTLYYNLH